MNDLWLGKPIWMWGIFLAIVVVLLVLDLGVLHKKDKEISAREAMTTLRPSEIELSPSQRASSMPTSTASGYRRASSARLASSNARGR